MKILFEKSLLKDIRRVKNDELKLRIEKVINELKKANSLSEINQAEKLRGSGTAYKIRIGEYRLGLFIESDKVICSRFLHRKDIYRRFP